MPLGMPMWPPALLSAPVARPMPNAAAPSPTAPIRRRWMIVDETVRREVDEETYRNALASCDRVEVAHYVHEDVVTHLCYRGKAP